jgi:hypothetical protein
MKIRKTWNKSIDQENEIDIQKSINKENLDNLSLADSINQYIKKVNNLSIDWVVLNNISSEQFFPSSKINDENLFYEWIVDFSFLPEFLIPYINVQILYRSPENLPQRAFDDDLITFKTNYIIQSEESEGNDLPKITLVANIFVRQRIDPQDIKELEIEDIEAKLLITLQNPNNFV